MSSAMRFDSMLDVKLLNDLIVMYVSGAVGFHELGDFERELNTLAMIVEDELLWSLVLDK